MNNNALRLSNGTLVQVETELPKLVNSNDVKIKVVYGGICAGTDLSILNGSFPAKNNVIPGHEISGVVVEIGEDVTHLKVGDRVCVNPFDACATCVYCVRGQTQFCIHDAMKTAHGIMKDGGWQQFVIVHGHLCYVLPESMSLEDSVFCQPLSNCIRGWDNIGRIHNESRIIVAGSGIIGLLWASLFHYHGYRDVTITEVCEQRKEIASRLNLGFRVCSPKVIKQEHEKALSENDDIWGYDLIVDCTGDKDAIETQFKWLRKGSTFLLFGVCGKGVKIDLEVFQIYRKEITVVSSYLNQFCYARTIKLLQGMSERYLKFDHLNVQRYPLKDYNTALDALRKGDISKAVFKFDE